MNRQKIFIFEFVSGGGFSRLKMPASLFSEGYGMLKCLIEDFYSLGFEIYTILDHRIAFLKSSLKANCLSTVTGMDDYLTIFKEAVKACDSTFIIAPEFSNILYNLTKIVKTLKKTLLSIDLNGIEIGTSKLFNQDFFKKNLLQTPTTHLVPLKNNIWDTDFIFKKFDDFKTPIVIKPEDGVGAESIFCFETKEQYETHLPSLINSIDFTRKFILQNFIDGRDLSVSLIGLLSRKDKSFNKVRIMSVNAQNLNIKELNKNSEYFGGHTPAEDFAKISGKLTRLLEKCDFSNFNGYFGMDFILDDRGSIYFIELNPRLTTSYIGLRNVVDNNIAELILESKGGQISLNEINIKRFSIYSRLELAYTGKLSNQELQIEIAQKLTQKVPEIVTPPISFSDPNSNKKANYSCFIATKTQDLSSSKKRIEEIKRILKSYGFDQL